MRAWVLPLGLLVAANLFGLRHLWAADAPWVDRENHDTRVMLRHLEQGGFSWEWFTGDWPLQNGMYRPLPTVAFYVDYRLWGSRIDLYRATNALIALACVLAVVWLAWELFRSRGLALLAGLVFTAWQTGLAGLPLVEPLSKLFAAGLLAYGAIERRGKARDWLLAAAAVWLIGLELSFGFGQTDLTNQTFDYRVFGWPPGRTATIMALFAVVGIAAYCRFERERLARWLLPAAIGLMGALASHEQAVAVPGLLLLAGGALALQGLRIRWWAPAAAWGVLGLYLWFHLTALTADSAYLQEHTRGIEGAARSLSHWLFPARQGILHLLQFFESGIGPPVAITFGFWASLANVAGNAGGLLAAAPYRRSAIGLIGSAWAYAPTSGLLPLSHYAYLPAAFRCLFVAALALSAWELLSRARSTELAPDQGLIDGGRQQHEPNQE